MITSGATDLDVIVGELTLLGGRRHSEAAHMTLLAPPRRAHGDRRSETLLLFLDLGGGGAGGLARAMLEQFNRTYWRCSGPVTTAVRQAISAANAHLREENRLMPIGQRRRAGLVCAVLRDDQVYLSRVGPAKAYIAQRGQVTQFPVEFQERLPLGVSSGLDIQFSHISLHPGDRLLLTGVSWTAGLPDGALVDALSADRAGAEQVMLGLERRAGVHPFSALVVECPPFAGPPALPPSGDHSSIATSRPQVSSPSAREEPSARPATWERQARSVSEPVAEEPSRSMHASSQVPARVAYPKEPFKPMESTRRLLSELFLDRVRLDQIREGLRGVGAVLGDGARALLIRVLPEPEVAPTLHRRRAGRDTLENVPLMASIAIGIPLLVAFVVVTFYLQRGDSQQREALVDRAYQAVETARLAGSADARTQWQQALQAAEDALSIAPEDQEILALRDQARDKLDELDDAVRPELVELWDYGAGQGRKVAVSRMQIYMLDAVQGQVTQHTLGQSRQSVSGDQSNGRPSEAPLTRVAYQGQRVGEKEIGKLRDIVWLSASGAWTADALLILIEGDELLQHSLAWGLSWVSFEIQEAADDVRVLRPYDGKLYALEPAASQVWRLYYTGNGFGEAEGYFMAPAPDLSTAVDMTVDGALYVLLADGQIYKFFGGERQSYELSGLPQPLARPIALVSEGDATSGALYVADAGAQSIVALTKSGEFIYQIKAPVLPGGSVDGSTLAGLEALALDQESRTLYILASGRLYSLALPPLPEPSATGE
jgi:hypothetical protein